MKIQIHHETFALLNASVGVVIDSDLKVEIIEIDQRVSRFNELSPHHLKESRSLRKALTPRRAVGRHTFLCYRWNDTTTRQIQTERKL